MAARPVGQVDSRLGGYQPPRRGSAPANPIADQRRPSLDHQAASAGPLYDAGVRGLEGLESRHPNRPLAGGDAPLFADSWGCFGQNALTTNFEGLPECFTPWSAPLTNPDIQSPTISSSVGVHHAEELDEEFASFPPSMSQPDLSCGNGNGMYSPFASADDPCFSSFGGLDFAHLAQSGQHAYADSFNLWQSPMAGQGEPAPAAPVDPLSEALYAGMAETIQSAQHVGSPPQADLNCPAPEVYPERPHQENTCGKFTVPVRPSYSEVAKNKTIGLSQPVSSVKTGRSSRSKRLSHQSKAEGFPEYVDGKMPSLRKHKIPKGVQGKIDKTSTSSGLSAVKPESHYGLDTFENMDVKAASISDEVSSDCSSECSTSMKSCAMTAQADHQPFPPGAVGKHKHATQGNVELPPRTVKVEKSRSLSQGANAGAKSPLLSTTGCAAPRSRHSSETEQKSDDGGTAKPRDFNRPPKSSGVAEEKLFFDPRRIFGTKPKAMAPRGGTPNPQDTEPQPPPAPSSSAPEPDTAFIPRPQPLSTPPETDLESERKARDVLNNDKPKAKAPQGNSSINSSYINNDLRDGSTRKQTNAELGGYRREHGVPVSRHERPFRHRTTASRARKQDAQSSRREQNTHDVSGSGGSSGRRKAKKETQEENVFLIGELLTSLWNTMAWMGSEGIQVLWSVTKIVLAVALMVLPLVLMPAKALLVKLWEYVKEVILRRAPNTGDDDDWWKSSTNEKKSRPAGLTENIVLPSSGEEAMQRLLSCKGKDPYGILGVCPDASDDVIKKYYRRQAVLVHPDKNEQPGAEEAFKILAHAFELVGEADKRKQYDAQRVETEFTEQAMHQFSDLLSKLNEKMQEAANLMRCDNCGDKHRRVPTDRPMYCARYCDGCNYRHAAREGDMWAESSMMGFLWHYYACMDGCVYDITAWASCQQDRFRVMKANSHNVFYRFTNNNQRQRPNPARPNEANLEDFLQQLFHQTASQGGCADGDANNAEDGDATYDPRFPGGAAAGPGTPWTKPSAAPAGAAGATSAGRKGKRRKRKR